MKIGNFDHNVLYYNLEREYTIYIGALHYKSPEVLLGFKQYILAFDIWSIGCSLVLIYTIK